MGSGRVLRILPGVVANISGVDITGGDLRSGIGGAIFNAGITTITRADISGNSASTATVANRGILNLNQVSLEATLQPVDRLLQTMELLRFEDAVLAGWAPITCLQSTTMPLPHLNSLTVRLQRA